MVSIRTQPITVALGSTPEQGLLLFVGRELVAMLVWLDPDLYANDPEIAGKWSLELGFGSCAFGNDTILFDTPENAVTWACRRVETADHS